MKNNTKRILFGVIYALFIAACVLLLRRESGVWRTLPFLLILPPAATLFVGQKTVTVLIMALCGLLAARVDGESLPHALLFALFVGFLSTIGVFIKRFLITARANDGRKTLSLVCAGILAAAGIVFHAFVFGTPTGCVSARNAARAYFSETYAQDAVRVGKTFYDPFAHRYESTVFFTDGESESRKSARFYREGTGVFDGYRAYYEARLLSQRRDEITLLLSERFPEYVFTVEGVSIDTESVLDENSTVEEFQKNMTFSVTFYTQFSNDAEYEAVCDRMRQALPVGTLVFVAAENQNVP